MLIGCVMDASMVRSRDGFMIQAGKKYIILPLPLRDFIGPHCFSTTICGLFQ